MDSVGVKRTVVRCLAVIAMCLVLSLIAPVVIAQQRTIHPGETAAVSYDGPVPFDVEVTTAKGAKKGTVEIAADITLGGESLADSYTATASSAYPAEGRAGLTYRFPYRPERRTYPYTDPFAPATVDFPARMDYIGPGSVGGLDTFKYRADVRADGYAAERVIDLEAETGTVLDETWAVDEGPVQGMFRMSEQSRNNAWQHAAAQVRVLRGLRVLGWLTGVATVVALVWAAVAVARR